MVYGYYLLSGGHYVHTLTPEQACRRFATVSSQPFALLWPIRKASARHSTVQQNTTQYYHYSTLNNINLTTQEPKAKAQPPPGDGQKQGEGGRDDLPSQTTYY
jgi:hypothetical protein